MLYLRKFVLEKEYKVKTKVVQADFSIGAVIYQHIEEEIKDMPIGILGM